ncbi:MAG TPA: hypothetical protein VEQ59_10590, partial [Polyangiaceae bacterium]|nr:hypothetical protein [Polyangiaceae bacterium]
MKHLESFAYLALLSLSSELACSVTDNVIGAMPGAGAAIGDSGSSNSSSGNGVGGDADTSGG